MIAAGKEEITAAQLLNALYDAGGAMAYADLRSAVAATPRQIWRAVYSQHNIGTIWRHREGEPIRLTTSARAAIAAGRMAVA